MRDMRDMRLRVREFLDRGRMAKSPAHALVGNAEVVARTSRFQKQSQKQASPVPFMYLMFLLSKIRTLGRTSPHVSSINTAHIRPVFPFSAR